MLLRAVSPMNLKPVLLFIILWIPISRTYFTSSLVSPLVAFSATNSAWNYLCSVVLSHILHVNIIVLTSHSQHEDINILLQHIEQVAQKSVTQWDDFPVTNDIVKASFRASSSSGLLVILDDKISLELKSDFRAMWRRVGAFLTPGSPIIMFILSKELDDCEPRNIRSLGFLPNAFIVLASCPHRVFFFDVHDDQSVSYLTRKNLSLALDIMRDLTADMRGKVFRVAMADFYPSAVFKNATNVQHMTGVDAYMLQEMSQYFNFTPQIVVPEDGLPFGIYVNGTGSGTIKPVVEGEADASFIGRFVMDYGTYDFDYTIPYQFDSLCVIVPKNPPFRMYKMIVMTFEPDVWLVVAVLYGTATVVWRGIKSFWLRTFSHCGFFDAFLDVYFLSLSGIIVTPVLKAPSARYFAASIYFLNLVLSGVLQGMIYTFTTSPIHRQIRTLKELDESGLLIETMFKDLVNTFPRNSQQDVIISLGTKVRNVPKESTWNWEPGKEATAALLRKNPAPLRLSKNANPNIHLVDECARNFYLSFILRKNHPIVPFFDQFIYWCLESGIVKKWLDDTYSVRNRTFDFSRQSSQAIRSESKNASLDYVAGALIILCSGLAGSLMVFLGEILCSLAMKKSRQLEIWLSRPYIDFRN